MSLMYFDGMDQYSAVPEPTAAAPVQVVLGASPSAFVGVPSDPAIFTVDTGNSNFQRHLNDDRVYLAIGQTLKDGISQDITPSSGGSSDSRWSSVLLNTTGHTIVSQKSVAEMKSWTIGFKLKYANSTKDTIQLAAFSTGSWTIGDTFGIGLDPNTGVVSIRAIYPGIGVLIGYPANDLSQQPTLGTSNFVMGGVTTSLHLLAANTVEITLYDTGRLTVWINNLYVGSCTFSTITRVSSITQARIGLNSSRFGYATFASYRGISDLYTLNGLGTENTSRLGKVKVVTRMPRSDVAVQFTRPDTINANYEVSSQNPAKISPALIGAKAGDKDIYASSAFNFTNEAIIATAVSTTGYKTDPTGNDIAPVLRIDGKDFVGATNSLPISSTAMKQGMHIYEVNPSTGQPFTKSELDATQFGAVVVAPGT